MAAVEPGVRDQLHRRSLEGFYGFGANRRADTRILSSDVKVELAGTDFTVPSTGYAGGG